MGVRAWKGGEYLGGVWKGETMIRLHDMKKNLFPPMEIKIIKKNQRKKINNSNFKVGCGTEKKILKRRNTNE